MFKHRWNHNIFLVIAVYFVQGAIAISGISEFLLTRNAFHFTWIQLALLSALTVLTWSIKPIYGFLTDLLPFFGSRRKNYLILVSLLPTLGYGYLAFFGVSFLPIAAALMVANIGLGFADVIVDGYIVETSTPETVGWYQAICWRSKAVGIFLAALFSGLLIERAVFSSWLKELPIAGWLNSTFPAAFPPGFIVAGINMLDVRAIFILTAILPLLTFVLAIFLNEPAVSQELIKKSRKKISVLYIFSALLALALTAIIVVFLSSKKESLFPFLANDAVSSLAIIFIWSAWISFYAFHLVRTQVAAPTLLYAGLFLFLWRFTPSFGAPWADYFMNTLKLSREKLGFLSSLEPLAWIIGSFLYVRFLDKLPLKKVLGGTVCFASALSLAQLTLANPALGWSLGAIPWIKYFAALLLSPAYFLAYGFSAWQEVLNQPAILNWNAVLDFFLQMMFMVSFLPLLKLSVAATPKGVEATNFAVLMSITNLGLVFGSVTGGMIYSVIEHGYSFGTVSLSGLQLTIIIGALTSLICLAVLPKLRAPNKTYGYSKLISL